MRPIGVTVQELCENMTKMADLVLPPGSANPFTDCIEISHTYSRNIDGTFDQLAK